MKETPDLESGEWEECAPQSIRYHESKVMSNFGGLLPVDSACSICRSSSSSVVYDNST